MDTSFTTNDEEAAVALSNLNLLGGASAEQLLPDGDIEDGLSTMEEKHPSVKKKGL